jgi:hypothetical protein
VTTFPNRPVSTTNYICSTFTRALLKGYNNEDPTWKTSHGSGRVVSPEMNISRISQEMSILTPQMVARPGLQDSKGACP